MTYEKNYNGIWMLVALVLMLGLPPIVGHMLMQPAVAETIHADAAH